MSHHSVQKQPQLNTLFFWIGVAALIFLSIAWRLRVFDTFPYGYDEGIHLVLAKLWAAGYTPYKEIFVSYPPFFMWSLGIPWLLFRQTAAIQLLMTLYAVAGVLAVVYLATVYHSRLAGLSAGALLSFSPAYFIPSFSVMTEIPSISIAVVGIALTEKYRRSGQWPWALLAGSVLAFGLSLKMLPIYAIPLAGLMLLSRHLGLTFDQTAGPVALKTSMWELGRAVVSMSGGFIIAFVLPIIFFDLPRFYEQVIEMRLVSRAVDYNPFESNNKTIIRFLFGNLGVTPLAIYGLVLVVVRDLRRYWLLLVWLLLVWISMVFHVPLRGKHLPIFLPVIAVFAGLGFDHIVSFAKNVRLSDLSYQTISMLATIIVTLGMVIWAVPAAIAENNGEFLTIEINEKRARALDFIDQVAVEDDCIIADNPIFVHQTRRLPPPDMSETSQTRVDTGYLTTEDVIRSIQRYDCHVVAAITPRFLELPGLTEWLAANYLALYAQSDTFVYFAKLGASQQNLRPLQDGNFGSLVTLYGVQLSQTLGRERQGHISLYWQLAAPIQGRYLEEIRLYDTQNQPIYQFARSPFEGKFAPEAWQVGQKVRDTFRVSLPSELPAGTYEIFVSLCEADSDQCLPVDQNTSVTEFLIGTIVVEE